MSLLWKTATDQGEVYWHASNSPTWEPREGFIHAGTRRAAEERAQNEADRDPRPYLHKLVINAPVHHEVVPDDYANYASGNKDHAKHEVYWSLNEDQKRFGTPPGNRVLHEIGKALRQGHVVPYLNHTEDEGSTSVVGKGTSFRHVGVEKIGDPDAS